MFQLDENCPQCADKGIERGLIDVSKEIRDDIALACPEHGFIRMVPHSGKNHVQSVEA